MREPQLAARIGKRDLAVVHVARQHELEAPGLEPVEHARKWQSRMRKSASRESAFGSDLRLAAHDQPRIGARDPDGAAAQLEQLALRRRSRCAGSSSRRFDGLGLADRARSR